MVTVVEAVTGNHMSNATGDGQWDFGDPIPATAVEAAGRCLARCQGGVEENRRQGHERREEMVAVQGLEPRTLRI